MFMPGYFCTVAHEDRAKQILFWAGIELLHRLDQKQMQKTISIYSIKAF